MDESPNLSPPSSDNPRSGGKTVVKKAAKNTPKKGVPKPAAANEPPKKQRPFPACSIEDALELPQAIQKHGGGARKVRKITLFKALDKSATSGASRMLITNSGKYGLTTGGYQNDFLELTDLGHVITSPDSTGKQRKQALFDAGISHIQPFVALYEHCKGNRLPSVALLEDQAREAKVPEEFLRECVETFVVNAKHIGLIQAIGGADRLLPIEAVIEEVNEAPGDRQLGRFSAFAQNLKSPTAAGIPTVDWAHTCFYISPIGDEGTEFRKHADMFLNSIVAPALEEHGFKVVRADQISEPGMIGRQVVEYILKSKLVVADLSFHNPNVFYELCLRHASRLPVVQLIRKSDRIPFDLDQHRTVRVDTSDMYALVGSLETLRIEVASQARHALEHPDAFDNPLTTFYPTIQLEF
jgi:hypothetical protein